MTRHDQEIAVNEIEMKYRQRACIRSKLISQVWGYSLNLSMTKLGGELVKIPTYIGSLGGPVRQVNLWKRRNLHANCPGGLRNIRFDRLLEKYTSVGKLN